MQFKGVSQLASHQNGTRVKYAGELEGHDSWSTTDKTSSLARQLAYNSDSRLVPVARLSCQSALFNENWLFAFLIHTTINTLIPTKCRELPEIILREKPKRKTRLTHPQSSSLDSPNSSTLTLSIDISLRGTFSKSLSRHTHISDKVFWCLGSSSEMTNSFGWCNGLIAGSGKLEKTRFCVTLLEQEAWRA